MIKLPKEINYAELYYTLRCNFKCPYCINNVNTVVRKREERSYVELAKAINNIDFGKLPLTIGGGEPTLREDFYSFINSLRKDISIDLLTNLSFNTATFIKELHPNRFTSQGDTTAYKSIRVSYHPQQSNPEELVEKVKRLQVQGFSIGIFGIASPNSIGPNIQMAELARKYGIYFFVKEYLGKFENSILGYYKYKDAVYHTAKKAQCRTSELLIDSSGKIYKCHRDLYDNDRELGNIFSEENIEFKYRDCSLYGECNPCDIKTKVSLNLKDNRCNVEIKRKIKKILLVVPPGTIYVQPDGTTQCKEGIFPIGLAYIAAQAKNYNYDVKIYDMVIEDFEKETILSSTTILYGATLNDYTKVLEEYNPDLVGIQCMLSSRSRSSIELARITKEFNASIFTVMGGHHATALPSHVLAGCTDFVLLGEADYSFPKLVEALNVEGDISKIDGLAYKGSDGTLIIQPQTNFVKNLDELPYPAWDTTSIKKYWHGNILPMGIPLKSNKYAVINTSRGCPHNCYYCAVPNHTGKRNYRTKDLNKVIDEIKWLIDTYDIEEIQFQDDNFFVNKKRLKELCKLLISNFPHIHFAVPTGTDVPNLDYELIDLLKQANFHHLSLGIETGDVTIQQGFVDKKIDLNSIKEKVAYIKNIGLEPSGFFLLGFPNETREQLQKTLDLATSLDLDKIHLIMLTPIPGSQLYEDCIKNNLLYDDFDVEKLRYTNTFIKNTNISREELERLRVDVWRKYMTTRNRG